MNISNFGLIQKYIIQGNIVSGDRPESRRTHTFSWR